MQLIRPGMLPMIQGMMMAFFFLIGVAGVFLLIYRIKKYRRNLNATQSLIRVIPGVVLTGFVLYNWLGYHQIYNQNEALLIGEYIAENSELKIEINPNNTWTLTENNTVKSKGNWQYIMSEDWNYWNIKSDDNQYFTQTGSSKKIAFKKLGLTFEKIRGIQST